MSDLTPETLAELRRLLALPALLPVLAELAVLLLAVGLCAELGSLLLAVLRGGLLLPAGAHDAALRLEAAWRAERLPHSPWPVHILYGSAAQQAQQLRPWITTPAQGNAPHLQDDCQECLDAASEHQLFQHLLRR